MSRRRVALSSAKRTGQGGDIGRNCLIAPGKIGFVDRDASQRPARLMGQSLGHEPDGQHNNKCHMIAAKSATMMPPNFQNYGLQFL
jgi:hypothetical protein